MTAAAEVRIPAERIAGRVAALADDIHSAYATSDPIFVTVLKGGVPFLADLVRGVKLPLEVDFLAISDYGPAGRAAFVKDLERDITGRHVLIVEDIVDTGLTLAYLLRALATRAPASLRVCTLLDRRVRRIAELPLDWVGFEVGDEYLVGYGLDHAERLRNLPAILAVRDRDAFRADPLAAARHALGAPRGG